MIAGLGLKVGLGGLETGQGVLVRMEALCQDHVSVGILAQD